LRLRRRWLGFDPSPHGRRAPPIEVPKDLLQGFVAERGQLFIELTAVHPVHAYLPARRSVPVAAGAVDARGRFRGTRAVGPVGPRPQGEACLTTGQPASSIGEPDRQRSMLARSPPGRAADLHCPLPCTITTSMQLLFCVASAAIATSRSRLASGGAPPSDLRRARSRCARAGRVVHGRLPCLGI